MVNHSNGASFAEIYEVKQSRRRCNDSTRNLELYHVISPSLPTVEIQNGDVVPTRHMCNSSHA